MATPPLGPKNPSATFYWNDWENDEALKACSLAAQGLWMRLLCIAARSPEPGVVQIGSLDCSLPRGLPRVAAATGRSLEEVAPLIDELTSSGAADLDRKKRIVCRRMVRAAALHKKRSEAGKTGADVTNRKRKEKEVLPQQNAGKPPGKPPANHPALQNLPSSDLHEEDDGESFTEDTSTAPAGAGAGERGDSQGVEAGLRKARAVARGTRLPDGWQPGPELEQFARELGLEPVAVTAEFVDYWRGVPGQRGVKLDWPATYRNRCRELAERRSVRGVRRPGQPSNARAIYEGAMSLEGQPLKGILDR